MSVIESQHVKPATCPGCSKVLDGATGVGSPSPGAFTVCAYCLTIGVFTETLDLRSVEPGELEDLDDDQRAYLDRVRTALLHHHEERRIMERFVFVQDEPIGAELERKVARGTAAVVGPLKSDGPPPRRMRPAAVRRCVKCRREIWVARAAPRGPLVMCPDCGLEAVKQSTRADT